jgi:hypothetical protein
MATDFSCTLVSDQRPEQVFKVIKNVRSWWSGLYAEEFTGESDEVNDEFSFRAGGGAHYSRQKLIELIPDKRIVWLVTEGRLEFVEHQAEWVGSKLIFELSEKDGKTYIVFTHQGLTPEIECYDSCAPAWSLYLNDKLLPLLRNLSGRGCLPSLPRWCFPVDNYYCNLIALKI